MSKRGRRDELTGRLTEDKRRKRRSLDPLTYSDTTLSVSTGGAGSTCGCPSTCPEEGVNFGPADARLEWYTDESTGTVVGHVYQDVNLESMGFVPGDDVISYCYDARIGPSTVPIETFCGGKLARLERGLVAAPLTNDMDLWYSSTTEASLSTSITWGGSAQVKRDVTTGKWVLFQGYGTHCGWGRAVFYDQLPTLTRGLLQFSYGRSGVATTRTDYVQDTANYSYWSAYTAPNDQLGGSRLEAGFTAGTGWGVARGGGLAINTQYTLGPGGSNTGGVGNPVSVFFNHSGSDAPYLSPRREWVTTRYNSSPVIGGPDPLITVSTSTAVGGGSDTLQFVNRDGGLAGLYGVVCPDIKDVGWATHWDILVMRDEKVEWHLNSSGRVAQMGGGIYYQQTPYGASTSDNVTYSHAVWREWSVFSTGAPLGGEWGDSYPQKGVRIYATSTLGTPILNCTEPVIYGGDVFAYSSLGFTVSTAGSTCCQTYVKLNFIDAYGAVLSTYGSTGGTNKYAEQRVTGVVNTLIPSDAVTARFTQVKTGACSCFGWSDDLMFSEGPCCIHYSPPIIVAIRDGLQAVTSTDGSVIGVTPAATAITAVYSTSNSTFISGDEIYDSVQEHSRVNLNVLPEAHTEICVASATGTVVGDPWPDVVLVDLGMSTADTLSFRWKVKVST
jgi:hypothetical protein